MLFKAQIDNLRYVLESNHKIYLWDGSVRSGKTTNVAACVPIMMERIPNDDFCIVGVSQATIERNVIRSFRQMFGDHNVIYRQGDKPKVFVCGRTFHCIGASDLRCESKIKGATFSGCIVDEVSEMPQEVFLALIQRISPPGAFMMCTTNPDSPMHWLKTDFIDRAEEVGLKHFIMRLEDNPSLPEDYIRTLKASNTGVWYKRFVLGEWAKSEGLVFPSFDDSCVIENAKPISPKYSCAVDFGTKNPCVFLSIAQDLAGWPRIWVDEERYFDSKAEGYYKTEMENALDCVDFCLERNIGEVVVDRSAFSFILTVRKEAKRRGVHLNVMAANNNQGPDRVRGSVLQGIYSVGNLFGTGDLKIRRRCKNLIKEIHSYSWKDNTQYTESEEPIKVKDHAVDALRYYVSTIGLKSERKPKHLCYNHLTDCPESFEIKSNNYKVLF